MSNSPRRSPAKTAISKPTTVVTRAGNASTERVVNPVSAVLGKTMKKVRIERDLSQEQLVGQAEVDRTLISRIERGVGNPSLLTLSTICYVLDITLSELLAPVKKNVKPRWLDPSAPIRRSNQAGAEYKATPSRKLR